MFVGLLHFVFTAAAVSHLIESMLLHLHFQIFITWFFPFGFFYVSFRFIFFFLFGFQFSWIFLFSFSTVIIKLSFFLRVFSCFFSVFGFTFELFLEIRSLLQHISFVLVYVQLSSHLNFQFPFLSLYVLVQILFSSLRAGFGG